MSDTQALIDRVLSSEPDRILDALIHEHLCDGFDMMPDASTDEVRAMLPDDVDAAAFLHEVGGFAIVAVPEYTATAESRGQAVERLRFMGR